MLLSNFIHRPQRHESDCMVACAEMALLHLGIQIDYVRLAQILQTQSDSTPFRHLQYLQLLNLVITIGNHTRIGGGIPKLFEQYIVLGLPVIVSVRTVAWRHWAGETTDHAVVVTGIDSQNDLIFIHDPFFPDAPIEMSLTAFTIGWEEKDRQYAVISLTDIEI